MSLMQGKGKKMVYGYVYAISSLPDEILAKILSFLPTRQAASTTVLSKRWRYLFHLMKRLFGSQHHYYLDDDTKKRDKGWKSRYGFTDFVDNILSRDNSVKKLSLKSRDQLICSKYADRWIHKAMELGVVDFELRLARSVNLLPPSIFKNKTLVKLTLGLEYLDRRINFEPVSLPVLKSLVLHTDFFLGEFLTVVVLPGCPILEELALHYKCMYRKYPEDLWISHKTLKRLTIHDRNGINQCDFKKVHTPSLVYLDCSAFALLIDCSAAGFTGSLVKAKLDFRKRYYNEGLHFVHMIIEWMRDIKVLSLSSSSVEMMMMLWSKKGSPLFMNLVKLSFESKREEDWKVLPRLLNKSPKLETLVLRGFHCVGNEAICTDPNEVKVLEIYGFRGSIEEVRQVKCLLSQMQFLQVMKVKIEAEDEEKRRFITSDLLALSKRSSEFQILFL